jgi:hypothetical protein
MKSVDKDIDKNNQQCVHFYGIMARFPTQIIACCVYRCPYLRFSYPLRPRAESAPFLLATLHTMGVLKA